MEEDEVVFTGIWLAVLLVVVVVFCFNLFLVTLTNTDFLGKK